MNEIALPACDGQYPSRPGSTGTSRGADEPGDGPGSCAGLVPLRVLLRDETRAIHEALHQLPAFRRLARSAISRAEYAALLQRMESFYAALDPVLLAACRHHASGAADADHAPRAPLLALDLARLGRRPVRDPAPALPKLSDAAAVAGALYVVDGALLGGATLAGAVRRLDWPAPSGFWGWCQAEGPPIWRRTLKLIERADRGPASRAAALAAAAGTFAAFDRWMAQLSPEPGQ